MASNNFVASKVSSETQRGRLNRLRSYITWLFEQFHDPLSVGEKLERNFEKRAGPENLNSSISGISA